LNPLLGGTRGGFLKVDRRLKEGKAIEAEEDVKALDALSSL
jgi:hypothetical protein